MPKNGRSTVLLYTDRSLESEIIRELLERGERDFRLVTSSSAYEDVPAIKTPNLTISGFENIIRYCFPESAEEVESILEART